MPTLCPTLVLTVLSGRLVCANAIIAASKLSAVFVAEGVKPVEARSAFVIVTVVSVCTALAPNTCCSVGAAISDKSSPVGSPIME